LRCSRIHTYARGVNVIRDVPILRTGVEYQLGSGPRTFTTDDLQAAVEAISDPHVRTPRLGIGHIDERFQPTADGDPAFGAATNLRLAESGNTIIADLEVGPDWLTPDVLSGAYPGRSIEATTNWTTPGGQRWPLVITAVKLLGTRWPGISTLNDLRRALTTGPDLVHASWREEPNEGGHMTPLIERLRALPADADDTAVMAVIHEHASSSSAPVVINAPPPVAETPEPQPEPEPEPQPEPVPTPAPEAAVPVVAGTSVIDNATLEELRRNAALGRDAHERQEREDRDRLLASAVVEGRFPPSRAEHYERLYDADPEGTQQLVASLAPGLVPVDERGGAPAATAAADVSNEPFEAMLPPELQAKHAEARNAGGAS
jgi:hypothetical protein